MLNSEHGKRESWIQRLRGFCARARGFRASDRGGVALMTALALPPILLVAMGAIQLQSVFSDRSRSQDVADAAALWGAQQLTVTQVGAEERSKAFAESQLGSMGANAAVTVKATKVGDSTMKVAVDTYRPSFFFNLLPFGGFYTHAEAVAEGVSQTPLCVVTFGTNSSDRMEVNNTSQLKAPQCLVHANEQVTVNGSALLQANIIETGASGVGPMSPSASTGAPDLADPFAGLNISNGDILGCTIFSIIPITVGNAATQTINPGCYGDITVNNGGTLNLNPGVYVIRGIFELKTAARLAGADVVLVFEQNATLKWKDGASITLEGRRTGALAGFVIAATRNRTNSLLIDSDPVSQLTGTIYVPNATLEINGSRQTAQASDWTVMAAQAIRLSNAPQVQINANYSGSSVPVPSGVGNKSKDTFTHLSQ